MGRPLPGFKPGQSPPPYSPESIALFAASRLRHARAWPHTNMSIIRTEDLVLGSSEKVIFCINCWFLIKPSQTSAVLKCEMMVLWQIHLRGTVLSVGWWFFFQFLYDRFCLDMHRLERHGELDDPRRYDGDGDEIPVFGLLQDAERQEGHAPARGDPPGRGELWVHHVQERL